MYIYFAFYFSVTVTFIGNPGEIPSTTLLRTILVAIHVMIPLKPGEN